jgi:hypothetical protein
MFHRDRPFVVLFVDEPPPAAGFVCGRCQRFLKILPLGVGAQCQPLLNVADVRIRKAALRPWATASDIFLERLVAPSVLGCLDAVETEGFQPAQEAGYRT